MAPFHWLASLPLTLCLLRADGPGTANPGRIEHLADFPSRFVKAHHVDVWLPTGYPQPGTCYAVVYMQDGQNLFDPKNAYGGVAWEVDSTVAALGTKLRPCIVVGVWNTARRFPEYTPAQPYATLPPATRARLEQAQPVGPLSDEYLKFLVQELKPYVDQHFQTSPKRADTFVAGSSMGGLVSLYAALEYPKVFGGAACFSTHWPLSLQENTPAFTTAMVQYLGRKLPRRHRPRLYFDYGSATLDAWYAPHQTRIDSVLRAHHYSAANWLTRSFRGAAHNEAAWKKRVPPALEFLLGY
ncbi:alpha/beta hydrolase-fold protein [Hymenobacter sp. M29]|uniref:Alpha/beta hydrolase-fold protein n=1 Tax=Hymenobacter mellowenesis TaxID=3063995 RepID=A0ABT9A969_9BACT|nr:alpha/beta hydrolase-fold protein [Hymenobacter sp. M29]MDO7846387.1 alpha/beta hydrolase-fold protein [Hymenobacter sp. M29]